MDKSNQSKKEMGITKQLAEFLCRLDFEEIPHQVVDLSKAHILDCIGVGLSGFTLSSSKRILSFVKSSGGNLQASVWGSGLKTSAQMAAFANGYMAHVLDWDDSSTTMRAHPTAAIFPGVLALGEMLDVSGDKILEGYILGVEIGVKMGRGINPQHAERWHATGTLGCLGAAAGSAKILGLDVDETRAAMGIAASAAGGLKINFGTMAKPFHAGNAARAGVMAALLAREGLKANPDVLDGPFGFCNIYCGEEHYHLERIVRGLGDPFEIYSPGFDLKQYPCGCHIVFGQKARHKTRGDRSDRMRCQLYDSYDPDSSESKNGFGGSI
jgi:2-methylcitrate dehydratase PrpD